MGDNRTTELLQELCDLACDVNAAEIIDHVHIIHSQWTFDSQWLDSWHTEFDRIADKLEQAIAAWNTRAERMCKLTPRSAHIHGMECHGFHCTACETAQLVPNGEGLLRASMMWKYCPNCGAKVVDE